MAVDRSTFALSFSAFLACLSIVVLTTVVIVRPIHLTSYGSYSGHQRALYATLTTVVASTITSFTSSQIRRLWVAEVDSRFLDAVRQNRVRNIQGEWRTVLGVGSVGDWFRYWKIQLSYLGTALVTTAIVASITPTLTTRTVEYDPLVSSGLPCDCAAVSNTPGDGYYWNLENGLTITAGGNWGGCPPRVAVTLMASINAQNPDVFAYSDLGVAVYPTAIGTPVTVYGSIAGLGQSLSDLLSVYGSNAVYTTQCVRTMNTNPISCHVGGMVDTSGGGGLIVVTSSDGACSVSAGAGYNLSVDSIMAKGMCTYGEVGQATIILGATFWYAWWLALAIGKPFGSDPHSSDTFAVTCNVDARDVFRYRNVTLSLQDTNQISKTNLGRQVAGFGEECEIFKPEENYGLLAIAAVANWQDLQQNEGSDGWFDSINQFTVDPTGSAPRLPPYAFQNSQNSLEDVLGLTAALVTSRLNSTTVRVPGTAMITSTRVGSGKLFGLVYVIPPFFAALVLLALMTRNSAAGERGFSTINLEDLIGSSGQRSFRGW
jgi:hypothetical protein